MTSTKIAGLACRHCRHYTPEGRRGGLCQQLTVPVQSHWQACTLALPPFAPSWEGIREITGLLPSKWILRNELGIQPILQKTSSVAVKVVKDCSQNEIFSTSSK